MDVETASATATLGDWVAALRWERGARPRAAARSASCCSTSWAWPAWGRRTPRSSASSMPGRSTRDRLPSSVPASTPASRPPPGSTQPRSSGSSSTRATSTPRAIPRRTGSPRSWRSPPRSRLNRLTCSSRSWRRMRWLHGSAEQPGFGPGCTRTAPGASSGAAAGCARLLRLDGEATAGAIDAAAGMPIAGHFASALDGNRVRDAWMGAANLSGLNAARLAAAGLASNTGHGRAVPRRASRTFDPQETDVGLGTALGRRARLLQAARSLLLHPPGGRRRAGAAGVRSRCPT